MTKIKLCGLSRPCDIEVANKLKPEYIGFVFAPKSRRYLSPKKAEELKKLLHPDILAVGVFVNEEIKTVANFLENGIIDIAQLHGNEDENYISKLRTLTDKPIIKAFRIENEDDIIVAEKCSADFVLLDSGNGGTGTAFDWSLISVLKKPYFLAGGLDTLNVKNAVEKLAPFAVDVSSGIEIDGLKDKQKMMDFVCAVRERT
ncbi:MAG: phosphoribosylanthranilate isomerase [Clostridia bacterium]|nr:phosphoribosylanthranilate isomerase [Clostridia bacterium]